MTTPHMSPEEFREAGHRLVDWIAGFMRTVEDMPVLAQTRPGDLLARLPKHPPEEPGGPGAWDDIVRDLDELILPAMTHWQSPNFFGYFPCNASGPAILGELVGAGLGAQGMLWQSGPACTELEMRTLDWMGEAIGLPDTFTSRSPDGGGSIQGTASEATLVALVAARARARRTAGADTPLTAYASTQAHSSFIKAAMIAGLADGPDDRRAVRMIETDAGLAMNPDALGRALRADRDAGRVPCFVLATVGTTGTTAIDPLTPIAVVIDRACDGGPRPWLHVDAAYAGSALVCPEFRWMSEGVERADSFCFNPHKWLLTNFDCDLLWTRDRRALTDALSVTPEYLRNAASESGGVIDYRDWQIPLGRRFRALKLWFVMRHYGIEGLRTHIRDGVRLASLVESWILSDERFEPAAKRSLSLVCFRLRAGDAPTRALLDRVNATGRAFLTHATLPDGRLFARMAIGATATRERHVRGAWALICAEADGVLAGHAG